MATKKTMGTTRAKTMTAMDHVKLARDPKRPHIFDFISGICGDFEELHGDRLVNDDRGLVCGFGTIDAFRCLVMGHHKGATIEENMEANFGMANPDGYRKAMRLAQLAARFHLPIVSFVDTPGAYPGKEAEERGQAEAIAKSLEFFSRLKTPIVVVVTGEGGSGGALAIAVGDRIVTENGIATAEDACRVAFIRQALDGVQHCIADGIPVKGYFYWSLMDNFEWQKGYAMQFGLIAVNRETMERTAKPSLGVLGSYAEK